MIRPFLIGILVYYGIIALTTSAIIKVNRITKNFERMNWRGSVVQTNGLDRITVNFKAAAVNLIIGSSGSGKSTLLKILVGVQQPTEGSLDADVHEQFSAYLDDHFYMSYDEKLTFNKMVKSDKMTKIYDYLDISSFACAESLMESDKRIFEIVLALSRLKDPYGSILCFDEYFDKDYKTTHIKIASFLTWLCRPDILGLQIFIVTHSKSVLRYFGNQKVVVLNKGTVFYESGEEFSCASFTYLPLQLKYEMID